MVSHWYSFSKDFMNSHWARYVTSQSHHVIVSHPDFGRSSLEDFVLQLEHISHRKPVKVSWAAYLPCPECCILHQCKFSPREKHCFLANTNRTCLAWKTVSSARQSREKFTVQTPSRTFLRRKARRPKAKLDRWLKDSFQGVSRKLHVIHTT